MNRLIICVDCGCTIQHNTPLEQGGVGLPVFGLCEDCYNARAEEHQERDEAAEKAETP